MTIPNGSRAATLRASQSLNVPWLSRPVRSSVRARTSAAWKISALRSAIETCAANSLTSSNSCSSNGCSRPEPLQRQHAGGALRPEQRDDDQAAVDLARVPEVVDPVVGGLVLDEHGLVVLHDPRRDPGLARLPRGEVLLGVDAAGGQRDEQAGRPLDDLDRDVVALDQRAQPLRDLLQHLALVERGEDRLGRAQELLLGAQLALERVRLRGAAAAVASALAIAWAANDA